MSPVIKTRSKQTLLNHNKFLTIEKHSVEFPDGFTVDDWAWVITPDFVNVVLVTDDEQFVFFQQPKYAYDGLSLAPIGGYLEPEEDPLAAAQRETLEETGYQADNWVSLGSYAVDANRGAGTAYAYLATGARKVAERNADDLEPQELVLLSRADVQAALFTNEIKVLPWINVVAMSLLYMQGQSNGHNS